MADLIQPGVAADKAAAPVEKPPADAPISTAHAVFDRLFAAGLARRHAIAATEARRYLQHAFYAGARAAFSAVLDSMQEQDAGEPEGEQRFAAIEREIDQYFTQIIGQATIGRAGRA